MAEEAHYSSGADSASAKRKYEDAGPPPPPRRVTGFSGPDSAPSYNNVPPPMDEIQLAKQKAQEIAARIFNNAEAKRSKFDNDGSGWETNDNRDFSSAPADLGHAAPSIPSYGFNSSKKIEIPNGKVGVIIGKAGETIKYLQLQSGAKIQITRDMDADPHSLTRDVDISGSADAIAKAEQLIKDVLAEAEAGGSGTVSRRVSGQSAGAEQFVMKIPNKKVGLVIGKGGETIKSMQASTGARIQVIPLHPPPGDTSTERTVQIDGTSDQIEAAKQMVNEVISENRVRNPMGGGYSQQGYQAQAPTSWAPPGQQMPQQGGYGYYNQPGAYPGQPTYPQQPYGGGYAGGWDQSSAQQTAQGGGGGGYDYYGQQQSQPTQPTGGPGSTDASAYGYGQQGQGYGQDGYYQQHGYGNPTSGYNVAGQTSDGQTAGYGAQTDNASQAPPTSAPQSGYGQQSGQNPSYPSQGSGQTGYGSQPSGYSGYGPPPTQKPPVSQPTNGQSPSATGYAQPPYGAPPTYGTAGYAQPPYGAPPANQPSYGAQQPPAYGGGYQQPPSAYSSDAASQAAPPVPKASPQQN
ncbi:hypothetical protein QVD17_27047 [Tagetes erecta]|uniref:K Homology domain-containing protein n=1 Tax=Tagetes erecta TaxID=13708 RepID=A0AAD8KB75_TARER|nr:hypothetical protein QVD17_27047 [Tagetes erecta]